MDYQDKVKSIYEVMADKTLSFGCMIISDFEDNKWVPLTMIHFEKCYSTDWLRLLWFGDIAKIIWHPLHIGYVIKYIEDNHKIKIVFGSELEFGTYENLIDKRVYTSQPIPLQPTEKRYRLIDFLYDLLPTPTP